MLWYVFSVNVQQHFEYSNKPITVITDMSAQYKHNCFRTQIKQDHLQHLSLKIRCCPSGLPILARAWLVSSCS